MEKKQCPNCSSLRTGVHSKKTGRYMCKDCRKSFIPGAEPKHDTNPKDNNLKWKEGKNGASLSGMARTPEELAEKFGVDMKVWEFDRVEIIFGSFTEL